MEYLQPELELTVHTYKVVRCCKYMIRVCIHRKATR